jgi:hypothetical protein
MQWHISLTQIILFYRIAACFSMNARHLQANCKKNMYLEEYYEVAVVF